MFDGSGNEEAMTGNRGKGSLRRSNHMERKQSLEMRPSGEVNDGARFSFRNHYLRYVNTLVVLSPKSGKTKTLQWSGGTKDKEEKKDRHGDHTCRTKVVTNKHQRYASWGGVRVVMAMPLRAEC